MCTLDQLTSQMASNIFEDLSNEQILFLKFCNGYNLKSSLLRSEVFNDDKFYIVKGFIWKYQVINFKNNGNFLDNELLIHLRYIQKSKNYELNTNKQSEQTSGMNSKATSGSTVSSSLYPYGGVVKLPTNNTNTLICSGNSIINSTLLTKDNIDQIYNRKENSLIKNKSNNDIFISLKEFCQKYQSQKFIFDKIVQQKKLKIVII